MNRRSEPRFGRPGLELLEARDLPSFLFPGTAVGNLVQPLNALNQDLQNHKSDLLKVVNNVLRPDENTPQDLGIMQFFLERATKNYQVMLNDQHAIDALSKTYLTFIQASASSELAAGDPIDFIVLNFGSFFGINIQSQFTSPATAADNAVNDPTVQNDVAKNWTYLQKGTNVSFEFSSIEVLTTTPPF